MPEPGMGANNDHSSSSVGSTGGGSNDNSTSTSSDNTTADNISSSNTTADNLSEATTSTDTDAPTTAESIANSPTTADTLSSTPTHGYDEVPSVAVSLDTPGSETAPPSDNANKPEPTSQLPDGVPNEYADLFGATPDPVGGVDAVWSNGDGTFSSSDGSTYDPSTGKGTYDPGEDSFAVTRTSVGITLDGQMVQMTERQRHPDRVRTSESLALVEHDPQNIAKAHGNRVAFDYYNNPNMDGIRDAALMQAAAKANAPVSGRYPGENLAYFGVVPMTAHMARSFRLGRPTQPELISQLPPGTKFDASNIVSITRRTDATLSWLEKGNPKAGLAHITSRHADDFAAAGIPRSQIPDAVTTAVERGRVVGYQGKGTGRPVVEYEFNGTTHRMAVTVSNNGFIVGANPVSMPKP